LLGEVVDGDLADCITSDSSRQFTRAIPRQQRPRERAWMARGRKEPTSPRS
jgi:hypothetical protein